MLSLTRPEEFVGNSCIYYTYRFFTFLQLLIGLGNIVAGIIICFNTNSLDWYDACYIVTGIILLFLAMFGYTTYNSISKLICYLIWLFICFCSELGFTIGILIVSEYNKYVGPDYANAAEYSMFAASGLLFLCFIFGCWYLSTVRDTYIERENQKLINNNR